jgi:hypothetical protein
MSIVTVDSSVRPLPPELTAWLATRGYNFTGFDEVSAPVGSNSCTNGEDTVMHFVACQFVDHGNNSGPGDDYGRWTPHPKLLDSDATVNARYELEEQIVQKTFLDNELSNHPYDTSAIDNRLAGEGFLRDLLDRKNEMNTYKDTVPPRSSNSTDPNEPPSPPSHGELVHHFVPKPSPLGSSPETFPINERCDTLFWNLWEFFPYKSVIGQAFYIPFSEKITLTEDIGIFLSNTNKYGIWRFEGTEATGGNLQDPSVEWFPITDAAVLQGKEIFVKNELNLERSWHQNWSLKDGKNYDVTAIRLIGMSVDDVGPIGTYTSDDINVTSWGFLREIVPTLLYEATIDGDGETIINEIVNVTTEVVYCNSSTIDTPTEKYWPPYIPYGGPPASPVRPTYDTEFAW